MSSLSQLEQDLKQFRALPYHSDTQLAQKLSEVQAWQRGRIHKTHQALFASANNQAPHIVGQLKIPPWLGCWRWQIKLGGFYEYDLSLIHI